jgi:pyruvate/2-oxoglutarate dehydrogenase complex dihydrolipoamide acyltransferase (E2) component
MVSVHPQRPRCFDPEIDHRIVDGAQAAAFLGELRDLIESPELALLDL